MNYKAKRELRRMITGYAIAGVLVLLIIGVAFSFWKCSRPVNQAEEEATTIAKKYADLSQVDDFYWFKRDKSSFTVMGKDKAGKEVVVFIPESGDKVTVMNKKDGLSEAEAKSIIHQEAPNETITKASLGLYKEQPAWEVVTKDKLGKLSYYLMAFKDGADMGTIKNI